jgi:diguanylate cyclase (GGDEF)-like protein/PAS domain S-box-containing protein
MSRTNDILTSFFSRTAGEKLNRLSTGIVIAMCAGLMLPALIGGMALTSLRQGQMAQEQERRLDDKISLLVNSLVDPVWNVDTRAIRTIAEASMLDPQVVRIAVSDRGESKPTLLFSLEHPERRIGKSRVVQRELMRKDEVLGEVTLEIDDGLMQREFQEVRRAFFLILLGQFVLALALILVALRFRLLKPLTRLARFSNQIAGGDLDHPLEWKQPDEIGRLAEQMDQMRASLRKSFAEQLAILNNVQVGVLFVRDRVIQLANRHAEQLFGFSVEEMKGLSTRVFHASDEDYAVTGELAYQAIAVPAGRYEDELFLRRRDGTAFLAHLRGSALDAAAPHAGSIWVIEDITERKRAEEELRASEEKLFTILENVDAYIYLKDPDGRYLFANRMVRELWQMPDMAEIIGCTDERFFDPATAAAIRRNDRLVLDDGETLRKEETNTTAHDGKLAVFQSTKLPLRRDDGSIYALCGISTDITGLKEHEKQLKHIAHYDVLTRLPNRVLLADRLHQAMAQAERHGRRLAVAYLDLDGFKGINDKHGHETGDQLLIALASRMKESLREGDTLARLGGDEFVAVLFDLEDALASDPMLTRLLTAVARPVPVNDLLLLVSASLGVTFYPQTEDVDADQLLRQADQAMYQAKVAGKNRYHVFDADLDRSVRGHHESLERIRQALANREFILYYQPKVNMRTGAVVGTEALIRWQHPERGLLPPAVFLPVVEDHTLAVDIGEWVIATALTQIDLWRSAGLNIPVSVNIGARQLQQPDFVDRLNGILKTHPVIGTGDLEMEILETSALEDLARVSGIIEACRALGISFALDDFGTGYSSLTYLKRLSVNLLKIDQSFVRDMLDDPDDLAILSGVLSLATAFRRDVIAEGVETVEHGEMLLQLGCELAQGYGVARPMPAHELPGWVRTWRPDPAWNGLSAVDRDDLPLLLAAVEHRAWLAAVEAYLRNDCENLPPLDAHCRFGDWLASQRQPDRASYPLFQSVRKLHGELHAQAAELCDLRRHEQAAQALAGLPELRAIQEALLEQMKILVRSRN